MLKEYPSLLKSSMTWKYDHAGMVSSAKQKQTSCSTARKWRNKDVEMHFASYTLEMREVHKHIENSNTKKGKAGETKVARPSKKEPKISV